MPKTIPNKRRDLLAKAVRSVYFERVGEADAEKLPVKPHRSEPIGAKPPLAKR